MSVEICSRVSGPRRYDMAQRVVNSAGASRPGSRIMNSRLPSPPITSPTYLTSTDPSADDTPSSKRALSCSVWRRPIIQVPALDKPL